MFRYGWLVLVLCLNLPAHAGEPRFDDIPLSEFTTGKTVSIADLEGDKPTYIKFWATWCKPCMEQMAHFAALHQTYADRVNVVAVNININEQRPHIGDVIEQYNLDMPVWLDDDGQLAQALGLVGTPYTVLINTAGNVVYTTHESDDRLDRFISMLAEGQQLESTGTEAITEAQQQALLEPWMKGEHLLFFTATWCDWYLKDSRPEMSQACEQVQSELNDLHAALNDKHWQGVVNHLWTDEQALADFMRLYDLKMPFLVDTGGALFTAFHIRSIPTLIRVKDGEVQARITDFRNADIVIEQLAH